MYVVCLYVGVWYVCMYVFCVQSPKDVLMCVYNCFVVMVWEEL